MPAKLVSRIPQIISEMPPRVEAAEIASAEAVAASAERLAPRRTGTLSESIQISREGGADGVWVVSPGVYYGGFVEWGTNDTRAQPYLEPAAEAEASAFYRSIGEAVQNL